VPRSPRLRRESDDASAHRSHHARLGRVGVCVTRVSHFCLRFLPSVLAYLNISSNHMPGSPLSSVHSMCRNTLATSLYTWGHGCTCTGPIKG